MINTQNNEEIKSFEKISLNDFSNLISKDPSIIYKKQKEIENRFSKIKVSNEHITNPDICTINDINRFIKLIFDRDQFTKSEFSILKTFVNKVLIDALNCSNDSRNECDLETKMIAAILADRDEVSTGFLGLLEDTTIREVSSYILLTIINFYITTDDVEDIVKDLLEIGITQMVKPKHIGNTEFILNYFCSRPLYMKEMVLVFKIISDIYTNEEAAYDFLQKYHEKYITSYRFSNDVDTILERYAKYLKLDDDVSCITYMIEVLGGDPTSNKTEKSIISDCDEFIENCGDILYQVPESILKCLIKDCVQVLLKNPYLNADKSRFSIVDNRISTKIREYKPAQEVPFEFPLPGYQDSPIEALEKLIIEEDKATEALHKDSVAMNSAEKKIYKAYRTYKESEEKVDSQITKAVKSMGKVAMGDVRTEIIEGKKFSAIGLLKRILATVGLFSLGPVKAAVALVIGYALKKKTTESERRKIIMELDTEIEMITEKIEDARGDNNREAKYAMMRTKRELENAKKRIQYGMEASEKDLANTNKLLNESREGGIS